MRKYLPAAALFGTIAAVYMICCTPDLTWTNVDCDGFYYYAKAVYLIDWGGNPVWAGLGWLASKVPIGSIPWRVAFFCSALPAIITSILIFLAVRKQTSNKYAPYIAAAAFAACPIVLSQASIHDVYSLATMSVAGAYCALVYKRRTLCVLLLGIAFCTHWATVLPIVIVFLLWEPQLLWRVWILVPFLAVPFLCESIWGDYPTISYWRSLWGVLLSGRLSTLPLRLLETSQIWLVALGLAWIPAVAFLKDWRKSLPYLLIITLPFIYMLTCLTVDGYVQSYVAMVFAAAAAGLGIERLKSKWLAPAVLTCSCLMLAAAPIFWDIGRTLDESPTTCRQWMDQVEATPTGSIIICSRQVDGIEDTIGGLARSGVEILNRETSKHYYYVYPSMYLHADDILNERTRLQAEGLKTPYVEFDGNYQKWQEANMLAFAGANDAKCYRTIVTEPETFKCELIQVGGNAN